ncbi:hypothetical protein [Bacteroides sp.]|uniref:hypothetical protein n=1 Tax=Bacteroides sp. TaxID=29523 RepID=UPI00261192F0|nr:hypothetical protein [Bacteroides sp.]MDD3038891.1 hypothetical protein [Bacteroides sp.]
MEYNVEELKNALIEKCRNESIIYAMVAVNRNTKEIILPKSLQDVLDNPNYYVCTCRKVEENYQIKEEK